MKRRYRRTLLVIAAFVAVILLYLPFRLFAQRFNTALPGFVDRTTGDLSGPDGFYHWFSVFVWPTYALLSGFLPLFVAKALRVRWWFLILLFVVALIMSDQITALDDLFHIPGGGLCGFNEYPANYAGMNTPHVSVILCPITFVVGALNVHTDPSLLDVAGAVEALLDLSLQDVAQADAGTGECGAESHPR